jgi:hypothetical protein
VRSRRVAALPRRQALDDYVALLEVPQLTPWNGTPHHEDNPDGAVRRWAFGPGAAGQVVYPIDDQAREVHLLLMQRLG